MMAAVPHVTFGLGLRKFQADGFLLTRVYIKFRSRGITQQKYTLSLQGCHKRFLANILFDVTDLERKPCLKNKTVLHYRLSNRHR